MTWPNAWASGDDPILELETQPPQWVYDALGDGPVRCEPTTGVHAVLSDSLVLLTTTIDSAAAMSAETFRAEVTLAYLRLDSALASTRRAPIRFWNYIPAINQKVGHRLDRYMAFNAGRYEALARRYGRPDPDNPWPIATASAVGVTGKDLVVHCLASDRTGSPVENPRQTSSWRYSKRHGPVPPCFSRATIAEIGGRPVLLIGGTASIVGEHSLHERDPAAQMLETLRNVGVLIAAAQGRLDHESHTLARLRDLRVYVRDDRAARVVRHGIQTHCPAARRVEIVRADVCRPELLVEIEGLADL